MQITYKAIDSLIPYVKNSRTHSDQQVAQIAASIKEFGFTNPVLLDEHGGIVAGHGRVMAARKLKLDEVPTITLGWLTDTQRRAYVIADNKLALNAGWDYELLKLEIEELKLQDFDLTIAGFDETELLNPEVDYGILDDDDGVDVEKMANGLVKGIQIEFQLEHYDEAFDLIKNIRKQGTDVGFIILQALREKK